MRYDSLDILRGLALLCLPLLNIASFSMPFAAYLNPYAYAGDNALNHIVFSFLQVVANEKFYGIFSILFGASMVLLATKSSNEDASPAWFMVKRLFWLLVFGLLHLFFVWEGDILSSYAVIGLFIFWLRNFSVYVLSGVWLVFVLLGGFLAYQVDAQLIDFSNPEYLSLQELYHPTQTQVSTWLDALRGSYTSVMGETSWKSEEETLTLGDGIVVNWVFGGLFKISSLMLLGMILFKTGVLLMQKSKRFYIVMAVVGIGLGYATSSFALYYSYSSSFAPQEFFYLGSLLFMSGSYITTIGYIGLIGALIKSGLCEKAFYYLAQAGRLAFTNYIMQSVICALIFYGYGGGLVGYLNRLELLIIAILISSSQLVFSNWWMKRFHQGPLEWLWRVLSIFKSQPFKREL